MKTNVLGIALLFALQLLAARAIAVDEPKRCYGRTTVTIVDAEEETEALLTETAKPKAQRSIRVYLDANTDCEALVVAFSKSTGALANGWRPVLLALETFTAQTASSKSEYWKWTEPAEPFEIFVVFLPRGVTGTAKARDLISKLRDSNTTHSVVKLQAKSLRQELIKWADAAIPTPPMSAPTKIIGIVRAGDEFPWRAHARTLGFSDAKPSVTIFRHAGK